MNSKNIRLVAILLMAAVAGCQTTDENKSLTTASSSRTKGSNESLVEKLLARVAKEPLRDYQIDEAYLIAESLIQEKRFEEAEKLSKAIFDASPTLVVGLKLARLRTLLGRTSEAESVIRKLVLLYPTNSEPPLALAYLAQLRGSKTEALEILATAYKNHSTNEEVAARYSEFLIEIGDKKKASTVLYEAIKKIPNSPYFLLRLARLRVEDKNYVEAKNLLDRLLRISPESIEGWTLAGLIAIEEKNHEGAERYFREAYEKQPENDTLARYYIAQLIKQEKLQEARRLLVKLESGSDSNSPMDVELTFQLGIVLLQLEEYAEAKPRFASLLDKVQDQGRILFFMGQCDESIKKLELARESYEKIPQTSSFYQQGLQRIILISLETGKFEEAKTLLATYKISEDDAELSHRFVATVHAKLKDYKRAMEVVHHGLKSFPKSEELGYLAAAYQEFTVSKDASLVAIEKFIQKHPKYTPALNHLGYSLAESGKRVEFAVELLKRAVELEPKNGFYLDSLGWAYFKMNKLEDAEKYLLLALQGEPEEPIILEHLGEVKMAKKDLPLALKYFERAQAMFKTKPTWKIESDSEWQTSEKRVADRISQIRKMALPSNLTTEQRVK